MLFKKSGLPESDELVLCTVTKVHQNAVFCSLDEYNDSGMIHISEISPGRIRNIRDYVKEGKKVVCLVLKVDTFKGHIDLSLRRVNDNQKRRKLDSIKQEQKAEKIIEMFAAEIKQPFKEMYAKISTPIFESYEMVHMAFVEVVEHNLDLTTLGIDKTIAKPLSIIVKDKIKPKQVEVSGSFSLTMFEENGIDIVKKAFLDAQAVDKKVELKYEGGGRYNLRVIAKEYKEAEDILKKAREVVITAIEANNGEIKFERIEK